MNKLVQISLSLMALAMTACLETVDSDQVVTEVVHQSYHVTYYEESDTTKVTADFRVGGQLGTSIRLKEPSSIKANGIELKEDDVFLGSGTQYERTFQGFQDQVTTVWKDQDGIPYTNHFEILPITMINAPTVAANNQKLRVQFLATEIDNKDSFSATINQSAGGGFTMVSTHDVSVEGGVVVFDIGAMSKLVSGEAELHITRKRKHSLSQATAEGGYGYSIFNTAPVRIQIQDMTTGTGLAAAPAMN